MELFSELQRQSLLIGCMSLHHRMAELEARVAEAKSSPALSGMVSDLAPVEHRILLDYFSRFRQELLNLLEANEIPAEAPRNGLRWTLQTGLIGMLVAIDEMGPSSLRGRGELTPAGHVAAERFQQNLRRIIDQAHRLLAQHSGVALSERLQRVSAALPRLADALQQIGEIVTRRGLTSFRPQLELILNRLENVHLEIAVFGRVSSGKSSLLNHIAGQDLLPVGILPVTAVPTRLTWGAEAIVQLEFADGRRKRIDVAELTQYASEAENPGNIRHVTRIEARLPSPRLQDGVVFVDTPGLGSLARSGGAETLAYLPRCDLGIVLIEAASTINDDDIRLIGLLLAAATPVQVLLSKIDVLNDAERRQVREYVDKKLSEELGTSLPIYPVSIIGQYESLLYEWFDREIRPLREQRKELIRASIARKTAHLADALASTLSRSRRAHDAPAEASQAKCEAIEAWLQAGDDVLRELASFSSRWRFDVPVHFDVDRALDRMVDALRASTLDGSCPPPEAARRAVSDVLAEHARRVWRQVKDTHAKLAQAIADLDRASRSSRLDVRGFEQLEWEPLPVAEWTPAQKAAEGAVPWWDAIRHLGAAAALRSRLETEHRREIDDAVADYDRRLDIWLRNALSALRAAYEAQTEVIRGELNKSAPLDQTVSPDASSEIQRDIGRLKEISGLLTGGDGSEPPAVGKNGSGNAPLVFHEAHSDAST